MAWFFASFHSASISSSVASSSERPFAESALRGTNAKFERRFAYIERALLAKGRSLEEATLEEMDALWNEAKNEKGEKPVAAAPILTKSTR